MDDEDAENLAPCCGCAGAERVRNIFMLPRRGPSPGKGWGCIVCGLPNDGAIAVMCDTCVDNAVDPQFVVVGYAKSGRRMPVSDLTDQRVFDHDEAKHRVDHAREPFFKDDDDDD